MLQHFRDFALYHYIFDHPEVFYEHKSEYRPEI